MNDWRFLTNHARALIFIAQDPNCRLRDIADSLEVTERTAFAIVMDLTQEGYVSKEKEGRRNRYSIQTDLPLRGSPGRQRRIGEFVNMFADAD